MNNIMIDLETTGMGPGCAILAIGAVEFSSTEQNLGKEFYQVVNLESCHTAGLRDDKSTLDWWEEQSAEARKVLHHAQAAPGGDPEVNKPLLNALAAFNNFITTCGPANMMKMWGNGASFDNAIMAEAYRAVNLKAGWDYWNDRCYRTLKGLYPQIKLIRTGTHHNALDDAKTQAEHALRILAKHYAKE